MDGQTKLISKTVMCTARLSTTFPYHLLNRKLSLSVILLVLIFVSHNKNIDMRSILEMQLALD